MTPRPPRQERSRYDAAQRRKAQRKGKETGVWIFVPAAELREAGIDPQAEAPTYRVWGKRGGQALVRFYKGAPA